MSTPSVASVSSFFSGEMTITVHRSKNLYNTQKFGKQDPFIQLQFGTQKLKSPVITDGGSQCQFDFPFVINVNSKGDEVIRIKAKAKGVISDEIIGEFSLSLFKTLSLCGKGPKWVEMVDAETMAAGRGQVEIEVQWVGTPTVNGFGEKATPNPQNPQNSQNIQSTPIPPVAAMPTPMDSSKAYAPLPAAAPTPSAPSAPFAPSAPLVIPFSQPIIQNADNQYVAVQKTFAPTPSASLVLSAPSPPSPSNSFSLQSTQWGFHLGIDPKSSPIIGCPVGFVSSTQQNAHLTMWIIEGNSVKHQASGMFLGISGSLKDGVSLTLQPKSSLFFSMDDVKGRELICETKDGNKTLHFALGTQQNFEKYDTTPDPAFFKPTILKAMESTSMFSSKVEKKKDEERGPIPLLKQPALSIAAHRGFFIKCLGVPYSCYVDFDWTSFAPYPVLRLKGDNEPIDFSRLPQFRLIGGKFLQNVETGKFVAPLDPTAGCEVKLSYDSRNLSKIGLVDWNRQSSISSPSQWQSLCEFHWKGDGSLMQISSFCVVSPNKVNGHPFKWLEMSGDITGTAWAFEYDQPPPAYPSPSSSSVPMTMSPQPQQMMFTAQPSAPYQSAQPIYTPQPNMPMQPMQPMQPMMNQMPMQQMQMGAPGGPQLGAPQTQTTYYSGE